MDIGAELKQARIACARYVPEIAHELKVPGPVIVAIEHNDFATVGNDARCSELVRAYAVAVGIDPEPLVTALAEAGGVVGVATSQAAQVAQSAAADRAAAAAVAQARADAQLAAEARAADDKAAAKATAAAAVAAATAAAVAGKAARKAQASEAHMTSGGSGTRRWATAAVVLAVLGAGGAWAVQANNDTPVTPPSTSASPTVTTPSATPAASDTTTAMPTSTASETSTMVPTETPTASPSTTSSPTPAPKPSATYLVTKVNGLIVFKINCVRPASLHVYNASGTIFSGRLKAGQVKKFISDTDATITTTNAGGLFMTVSGTEYGILGEPGQVYTHKFRIG